MNILVYGEPAAPPAGRSERLLSAVPLQQLCEVHPPTFPPGKCVSKHPTEQAAFEMESGRVKDAQFTVSTNTGSRQIAPASGLLGKCAKTQRGAKWQL